MDHLRFLGDLVTEKWPRTTRVVHGRVADIRALLSVLGDDYAALDHHAAEIETISGTAMGFGDDTLTDDDMAALLDHVAAFQATLKQINQNAENP